MVKKTVLTLFALMVMFLHLAQQLLQPMMMTMLQKALKMVVSIALITMPLSLSTTLMKPLKLKTKMAT